MPARSVRRVPRFHCGLDFSRTGSGLPCPRRNDTRKYTEILCIFAWFRLHCVTRPVNHCVQSRSNVFSARFSTRGNIYYWQFTPRIVPCGNCPRNLKSLLVDHRDKLNSNAWFSHEIQPRVIVPRFGYSRFDARGSRRVDWSRVYRIFRHCYRHTLLSPNFSTEFELWRNTRSWLRANINCWSCDLKSIRFKRAFRTIVLHVVCVFFFSLLLLFSPFLYTQIFMRV